MSSEPDLDLLKAIQDDARGRSPATILLVPLARPEVSPLEEAVRVTARLMRPWRVSQLRSALARVMTAARAAA